MKKINRFFVAAIVGIAAACSQELSDETPGVNTGNTEEAIPENYIELTFATNATDVKTSVDGNTVSWSEGDKILVCWDGDSMESNAVEIKDGMAYFTVSVDPEATDFYAVYPSTIAASVTDGSFSVTVPQSQSGRFADADIIVAKTTKDVLVYNFRHAVSLVKFVISDDNTKGITRAQFVDLANDSQLYGTMAITFDEDNQIATSTVTEDPTLDVIDVTAVQTGDNYMAVLPEKALAGFGLRLGSESKWHPGLVGENAITLGERLSLDTVDTKIHEGDYYIKTEATGKGNGTSWENAGDAALLQSLMGDANSYNGVKNLARGWRINGKTICVAAGSYTAVRNIGFTAGYSSDTWTEKVSFTIEGGYNAAGGKDETAQTVFGPTEGTENKRAFFFYDSINATLKDIYIQNHSYSSAQGGGAYLAGGAVLNLESCTFDNNTVTNEKFGGAISVANSSLSAKSCVFSNNKAHGDGGAIYINNGQFSAENVSFIKNTCRYESRALNSGASNKDVGEGGAALRINAYSDSENITAETPVTITLDKCIFNGNHAIYSTGGAFYSTTTHLKLTANNCKFLNNISDGNYTAAVFSIASPSNATTANQTYAYFNACEFRGNEAKNFTNYNGSHIAYVHYAYTNLGFNNCLSVDNATTSSYYHSIYTRGPLILSNSTFIGETSKGSTGLIKADNIKESYPASIVNNIILNTATESRWGFLPNSWTSSYLTYKYNLYGTYTNTSVPTDTNVNITTLNSSEATTYDTHSAGTAADVTSGMSYYLWSGTQDGFTQTTKNNVASAIQSNTAFGADFYNWLNGLNALDYDIRGVARTNGYWPGSYQNN